MIIKQLKKETIWRCNSLNNKDIEELSKKLNISKTGASILVNRGIKSELDAFNFLNPSLSSLDDPFLLPNMEKGVNRVIQAIKNSENIYSFGDYDVDGTTSLSILTLFLNEIKVNNQYILSDRHTHGYGLNREAIDFIHSKNGKLLITLDCGTSNISEIAYAKEFGIDVIVIDHHQIPDETPNAILINPYLKENRFSTQFMAAVGVTFNFLMGLRKKLREIGFFKNIKEPNLKHYLDITAIGTIADIVPLLNENRVFVYYGLEQMNHTIHSGLRAMLDEAELKPPYTSEQIAFKIAPWINAAGRLGDATKVVDLLTTTESELSKKIAVELHEENIKRQKIEREIFEEIVSEIEGEDELPTAIIMANDKWHHGVIGIVASKLIERFHRPVFLFAIKDGIARGSARSINDFHLFENLSAISYLFENYGGHKYAAGMSLKIENFETFKDKMLLRARLFFTEPEKLVQEIKLDTILDEKDINIKTFNELKQFAPFGEGNPEPLFSIIDSTLLQAQKDKTGVHLVNVKISKNSLDFKGVGFNLGYLLDEGLDQIDALFYLGINEWNNKTFLQLKLKDIKKSDSENITFDI
ncbi:single-stranded-DNA-specific exonuclease RecJ [bacterium]|nr:single-stranded-DNA-specific exonuclease RecJ [bacterium]